MDTASIITEELEDEEGIFSTSGDAIKARRRARHSLQRVADELWNLREWEFTYATLPIVLAANTDIADFAVDQKFLDEGKAGHGWLTNNPYQRISWRPLATLIDFQKGRQTTGTPLYYSFGPPRAGSYSYSVYFWPKPGVSTPVTIFARVVAPEVHDSADGADGGSDGIAAFPEQWRSVLYEGLVFFQMKSKGNIQSVTEQRAVYTEAKNRMIRTERPGKNVSHRLVPYGFGRRM